MDFELERQTQMAERKREVAHLHLSAEARGLKPRGAVEPGAQEGSSGSNTHLAFFHLVNMFAAFGLVASPSVDPSTNPK